MERLSEQYGSEDPLFAQQEVWLENALGEVSEIGGLGAGLA
jgi:hypothetical protein